MVLIIDNYDSFTYNICHCIDISKHRYKIIKNDSSINQIKGLNPSHIIISPGPYSPDNGAGICTEVVRQFFYSIPILGICLGAQIIAYAFNGRIVNAPIVAHGVVSEIFCDNKSRIFKGLPEKFMGTRYHSLSIDCNSILTEFNVTAFTNDTANNRTIMAIEHKTEQLYGVQFHPESIKTEHGKDIITNFINI